MWLWLTLISDLSVLSSTQMNLDKCEMQPPTVCATSCQPAVASDLETIQVLGDSCVYKGQTGGTGEGSGATPVCGASVLQMYTGERKRESLEASAFSYTQPIIILR